MSQSIQSKFKHISEIRSFVVNMSDKFNPEEMAREVINEAYFNGCVVTVQMGGCELVFNPFNNTATLDESVKLMADNFNKVMQHLTAQALKQQSKIIRPEFGKN